MLDTIIFAAVCFLTIGSAFLVFIFKKLLHAVIALTFVFVGSAGILLSLGQTLLALAQLLVFVGGLSTYLIVAVATEQKATKIISMPLFIALALLFFMGVGLFALQTVSVQQNAPAAPVGIQTLIANAFKGSYLLLYFMALLLFSTTAGGVLVIKKFTKLLV